MSGDNRIDRQFRIGIDATALVAGLAAVWYIASTVAPPNARLIVGLGFAYGLALAGYAYWILRRGEAVTAHPALFPALLVVPFPLLLGIVRRSHAVETVLLFFGIAVVPGAVLELYRVLSGR